MRLYNLYMERDGRKVPIGTCVSGSPALCLDDLPSPPSGVRYLNPEEVISSEAYANAIRRYEEIARSSSVEESRAAERTAGALRRRLDEIRIGVPTLEAMRPDSAAKSIDLRLGGLTSTRHVD